MMLGRTAGLTLTGLSWKISGGKALVALAGAGGVVGRAGAVGLVAAMAGTVIRTSNVRLARPAAATRRSAVMKFLYYIKRGWRDRASGDSAHPVCADGRSCNPQRNKKAPALPSRGCRATGLAVAASRPGLLRGALTDLDALCAAA